MLYSINTLWPRQNGRHFSDDIFKCIFLNENVWISIKIPVKFVPKGPINNIPALFQIMAWRLPGDKPLSETVLVTLLTSICVTQPQWVKDRPPSLNQSYFLLSVNSTCIWILRNRVIVCVYLGHVTLICHFHFRRNYDNVLLQMVVTGSNIN